MKKVVFTSDVTGAEHELADLVTIRVKDYPTLGESTVIDVARDEVPALFNGAGRVQKKRGRRATSVAEPVAA